MSGFCDICSQRKAVCAGDFADSIVEPESVISDASARIQAAHQSIAIETVGRVWAACEKILQKLSQRAKQRRQLAAGGRRTQHAAAVL
ncbi:MAG: hypothetical protein KDA41_02170, partial [Planctomycetales bacterium]|nr:hypothetical protein [Planctomycetales bacterium]